MTDRIAELTEALRTGADNGWERVPGSRDTVRRVTEHATPQFAKDNGWWTSDTYSTCEFLSFTFGSRTRVPSVVYGVRTCPWVQGSDKRISYRNALFLLAQPLASSELHDH